MSVRSAVITTSDKRRFALSAFMLAVSSVKSTPTAEKAKSVSNVRLSLPKVRALSELDVYDSPLSQPVIFWVKGLAFQPAS